MATVKIRKNNGKLRYLNTNYIIYFEQAGNNNQNTKFSIVQGEEDTYQELDTLKVENFLSAATDFDPIDVTVLQPDP